ncbi:hypothetical protein VB712_03990 [Spirulina sp. CCNP1310]|uniref:hypothetical protein n=1 Tax=Spirulina sp. CCNP1310 TaxID=3110249 RepID=UPI002B1EC2F5|nr:hypothetical protein [Spirulina sp. CCNP1310]MEA5418373.1 hypothetical protein [Spirulina sp. CCNP1310]
MKKVVLGISVALCTFFAQSSNAEMYNLGPASTGQPIILDGSSVSMNGRNSASAWVGFTYYLGRTRFAADAHCGKGEWYSGGSTHKPQSQATRNMLSIVCSARWRDQDAEDTGYMLVFDPPSNVRNQPNGNVIFTVTEMIVIPVYPESQNGWFSTYSFGGGWIHESQLRPFY